MSKNYDKAIITKSGAVLLGKHIVCDGFEENRSIQVISHFHGDHLGNFERCLATCESILVTYATKELLAALRGEWLLIRRNLKAVDYNEPFEYKDEIITLHPANHVLGSAQVLVENEDGDRILYTGDFNIPDTPIIESDILVIEATYGKSCAVRTNERGLLIDQLISLLKEKLRQGPAYIFSRQGKIQELMSIFNERNIDIPFLVPKKVYKIAKAYEKFGVYIGDCLPIDEPRANEIFEKGQPYIAFYTIGSEKKVPESAKFLRIRISAWEATSPFLQISENYYIVALSDHADFNGLIEYVKKSNPRLVITDSQRGLGISLAQEIRSRLSIDAIAMPYR